MPGQVFKATCACGFSKEWQVAMLSDPFCEETDGDFSLEIFNEAMKRKAEMLGPHHCPKCQSRSLSYFLLPAHRN
jgi:hypothetical protein